MIMLFLIQKSAVNRQLSDFCLDYGLQHFYGKVSHPLLWAGPRAVRGKIAVSGNLTT